MYFIRTLNNTHCTTAYFLPNTPTLGQYLAILFQQIAHYAGVAFLTLRSLGMGLHDVQFTILSVLRPFNLHRMPVVFFDH